MARVPRLVAQQQASAPRASVMPPHDLEFTVPFTTTMVRLLPTTALQLCYFRIRMIVFSRRLVSTSPASSHGRHPSSHHVPAFPLSPSCLLPFNVLPFSFPMHRLSSSPRLPDVLRHCLSVDSPFVASATTTLSRVPSRLAHARTTSFSQSHHHTSSSSRLLFLSPHLLYP